MAQTIQTIHTTGHYGYEFITLQHLASSVSRCRYLQLSTARLVLKRYSTFGTSVYTPALADIMADFNVSRTAALVGITVYTLGLGFGPIMSAPLSEKHGRKIVYLLSSPIFMLFTLGAGLSKSFASLIVCRFFAGLTGSPALAVGAGSNADLFPPHQRAKITAVFLMAPFAGPSLG
jgi:MFS family permease